VLAGEVRRLERGGLDEGEVAAAARGQGGPELPGRRLERRRVDHDELGWVERDRKDRIDHGLGESIGRERALGVAGLDEAAVARIKAIIISAEIGDGLGNRFISTSMDFRRESSSAHLLDAFLTETSRLVDAMNVSVFFYRVFPESEVYSEGPGGCQMFERQCSRPILDFFETVPMLPHSGWMENPPPCSARAEEPQVSFLENSGRPA